MKNKKRRRTSHGLHALREKVAIRGLAVIDRRSRGGRILFEWRADLLTALGGEANITPQKRALVDMVVRTRMYIDHADAYLMSLPDVIVRRRKTFMSLVRERTSLCETLARLLDRLGLERQAKPVEDLAVYMDRKARALEKRTGKEEETGNGATDDHPGDD